MQYPEGSEKRQVVNERESLFERIISRAKNNRVAACFLVLGTVVIALATFTDAARRILDLISGQSPQEARIELGKMSLEYSPDAFVRSAQRGDLSAIKLFVAAGMDVNAKNGRGDPALACAAGAGHTAIVRALIDAKADVLEQDADGRTALSEAAYTERIDVLQLLLKHDFDVHSRNEAVAKAARSGHTQALSVLKDAGVGDHQAWSSALFWAVNSDIPIYDKVPDSIKFLLENGADPNVSKDDSGYSTLMWAIQRGRIDIGRYLMKHGADVNAKGADGKTALMLAIAGGGGGNEDLIKDLLDHGARTSEKDIHGYTAFTLAGSVLEGDRRKEVIRLLKGSAGR